MRNKSIIAVVFMWVLAIAPTIYAGEEPEEYADVEGPITTTACPGINSCSRTLTAGNYYCDSCWFWGCGCQCYTGAGVLVVQNQQGDCHVDTWGVPPFTASVAACYNWHTVSTTSTAGTACWTPAG